MSYKANDGECTGVASVMKENCQVTVNHSLPEVLIVSLSLSLSLYLSHSLSFSLARLLCLSLETKCLLKNVVLGCWGLRFASVRGM